MSLRLSLNELAAQTHSTIYLNQGPKRQAKPMYRIKNQDAQFVAVKCQSGWLSVEKMQGSTSMAAGVFQDAEEPERFNIHSKNKSLAKEPLKHLYKSPT